MEKFMPQTDWNMVAACANVVIATTAVVAAWYALRQYRYSVRSQELTQILEIYKTHTSFNNKVTSGAPDEAMLVDILLHFEMQERAIDAKILSKPAMDFYNDLFAIEGLSVAKGQHLTMLRSILHTDQETYKMVIHKLKTNQKTRFIINW